MVSGPDTCLPPPNPEARLASGRRHAPPRLERRWCKSGDPLQDYFTISATASRTIWSRLYRG